LSPRQRQEKARREQLHFYIDTCLQTACKVLVQKSEGKHSCKWVDNTKMDHSQIGWMGVDWIRVAQCRAPVDTVMNLQVSQNAGNSFTSFPRSIHCVRNRLDFLCAARYSIRLGVIIIIIIIKEQ
jgi:hypothetical protein